MADSASKSYSSDPTLWLYTSLSSGSSQIVTATSRLETILKANRIPFKALDVATDEKARMLWGRRAGKRRLPGLVRMGMVVGDIDEIEEWNEYGELKEQVGAVVPTAASTEPLVKTTTATASASGVSSVSSTSGANAVESKPSSTPSITKPASSISFAPEKSKEQSVGGTQASISLAMRHLGQEAAERAKKNKSEALAARKAQVVAAEKLAESAAIPAPTGIISTESAKAPESLQADANVEADSVSVVQSKNVSSSTTSDLVGTEEVEPESKVGTASGAHAARPESPLPNPGESATTSMLDQNKSPASTATNHDAGTIAQSTASVTDPSRTEGSSSTAKEPESAEDPQPVISRSSSKADAKEIVPGTEIGKHRGSSISIASKEEIKQIEEASKIPEEPEEDAEKDVKTVRPVKTKDEPQVQLAGENQGDEVDRLKKESSQDSSSRMVDKKMIDINTASDADKKQEAGLSKAVETVKTQEQPAADPAKAMESVHD